ncbi:MAG: tetratricopeptide repeat protein [Rhodospirillales bacterium]|nr:tetratricopeptide repeat protein [Rhodospirillales bacterium]
MDKLGFGPFRLGAAIILAALALGPGGVLADDYQANKAACLAEDNPLDQRIAACTGVLRSNQTDRVRAGAWAIRGDAYLKMGNHDRALPDFNAALRYNPDLGLAIKGRAYLSLDERNYDQAIEDYTTLLAHYPKDITYLVNRSLAWLGKGDIGKAVDDQKRASDLCEAKPDRKSCHVVVGLSFVRLAKRIGRLNVVEEELKELRQEVPDDSSVLNALAWFRATATEAAYRNGAEAIGLAQQAMARRDSPFFRDTLAAALAEAGRFESAVREAESAIRMVEQLGQSAVADRFKDRRDLYRQNQPLRCPSLRCD